jgi:hypothetical protein
MVCCALGTMLVAVLAIWWRRLKAAFGIGLGARSIVAGSAVAMIVVAAAALTMEHLGHHAAQANGGESALLADIDAQLLCRATPSRDRLAAVTNMKE